MADIKELNTVNDEPNSNTFRSEPHSHRGYIYDRFWGRFDAGRGGNILSFCEWLQPIINFFLLYTVSEYLEWVCATRE